MYEYLKPAGGVRPSWRTSSRRRAAERPRRRDAVERIDDRRRPYVRPIDRTAKLFIGGKQARPDGGYSRAVSCADRHVRRRSGRGQSQGHPQRGRRGARGGEMVGGERAQPRADAVLPRGKSGGARRRIRAPIVGATDATPPRRSGRSTHRSSACSLTRAWADKFDGAVHTPPLRGVALAMNEPLGVIGIACPDEAPLLGFRLAGRARARDRQSRGGPAERGMPLDGDGLLPGCRDVGRAGGRDQYRHGRARWLAARARQARRCRCDLVLRPACRSDTAWSANRSAI